MHYGEHFMAGFAGKEWRFTTTILFLSELLTFFVMGWLIHSVVAGKDLAISYEDACLLAAIAPVQLWLSSLALLAPSLAFSVVVVLIAMGLSCTLIYQGLRALSHRPDTDVEAMSATYTIMAASFLAWALLMVMVWASQITCDGRRQPFFWRLDAALFKREKVAGTAPSQAANWLSGTRFVSSGYSSCINA